jgi:hypothetical protein
MAERVMRMSIFVSMFEIKRSSSSSTGEGLFIASFS